MTKKITNEQLAAMIQLGFQETAKKTYVDERHEQLAAMIQLGFQETAKKTYVDERHEQLAAIIQLGFQETAGKSYVDERFEQLAVMIQRGFQETASRAYVDERFASIDERFNTLTDIIRLMQDDIHDIKITLSPLVGMVAAAETDIEHLTVRVSRLEHKVGMRK